MLGVLVSIVFGLLVGVLLCSGCLMVLVGLGVVIVVLGLLLVGVLLLNKQLWMFSYVLWIGGLVVLVLWLGYVLIDLKGWLVLGWCFGVNVIIVYLGVLVMLVVLMVSGVWSWIWQQFVVVMLQVFELVLMLQVLVFVVLWWGVVWWLDWWKIYLKI